MSSEAHLRERIERLRDALAHVRDRDPRRDTSGGATMSTYIAHVEQIRQLAMHALQHDDAHAAVKSGE